MPKALQFAERACDLDHPWGCVNAARMYSVGALRTLLPQLLPCSPLTVIARFLFAPLVSIYQPFLPCQAMECPRTRPRLRSSRKRRDYSRRASRRVVSPRVGFEFRRCCRSVMLPPARLRRRRNNLKECKQQLKKAIAERWMAFADWLLCPLPPCSFILPALLFSPSPIL